MKKSLIIISILFLVGCAEKKHNSKPDIIWVISGHDTVKINNGNIDLTSVEQSEGGMLNDSVFFVRVFIKNWEGTWIAIPPPKDTGMVYWRGDAGAAFNSPIPPPSKSKKYLDSIQATLGEPSTLILTTPNTRY